MADFSDMYDHFPVQLGDYLFDIASIDWPAMNAVIRIHRTDRRSVTLKEVAVYRLLTDEERRRPDLVEVLRQRCERLHEAPHEDIALLAAHGCGAVLERPRSVPAPLLETIEAHLALAMGLDHVGYEAASVDGEGQLRVRLQQVSARIGGLGEIRAESSVVLLRADAVERVDTKALERKLTDPARRRAFDAAARGEPRLDPLFPAADVSLARCLMQLDHEMCARDPERHAALRPPASDAALDALSERMFSGGEILEDLIQWFRWHDGADGIAHLNPDNNFTPMSIESALSVRAFQLGPESDGADFEATWLPLFDNGGGDYLVYRTAGERAGRIVVFRHDERAALASHESLAHLVIDALTQWRYRQRAE